MIGLRRTYDGIIIKPCIPKEWGTVKISREYRGTKYNVIINNPPLKVSDPANAGGMADRSGDSPPLKGVAGRPGDVKKILVDGNEFDFTKPLPIDNSEHEIVVTLN